MPAPVGELTQLVVSLVTWIRDKRGTTGMRNRDRRRRSLDRLQGSTLAGMGQIDQRLALIQACYKLAAIHRQAAVTRLKAAIPHKIAPVRGQLEDADSEVAKEIDPNASFAIRIRILTTINQTQSAAAL